MRTLACIFLIVWWQTTLGQYPLLTSNNHQNNIFFNAAFAGSLDYIYANAIHRQQWQAFDDSPQLNFVSVGGPLRNEKIGIALHYKNASSGVFSANQMEANINYNLLIGEKINKQKISFGLGIGVQSETIGFNKASTTSANDPSFSYQIKSQNTLLLPAGIYYKSAKQEGGISISNLLKDQSFVAFYQRKLIQTRTFSLKGNLTFRKLDEVYRTIDIQTILSYSDFLSLGAGYRSNNTFTFLVGAKIISKINVFFAYDLATSSTTNVPLNASEISVQYEFGSRIKSSNTKVFH